MNKNVDKIVDKYFNTYEEYNELTINDYFTDLFYEIEDENDLDIINEAESRVRNMVFND